MSWFPSIGRLEGLHSEEIPFFLLVGSLCFLAGWWLGRWSRRRADSSVFTALVHYLQARRPALFSERHLYHRGSEWRQRVLEETRERIRRRNYWKSRGAFTLLELLLAMLIIAILAALLLPVVEKARSRSRLVSCGNQLRQAGIAFHGFAHDHQDQFPFQASTNRGGTLELVYAGERMGDGFYFAFRHFQALSNDLDSPRVLACPSDSRTAADSFADLANGNISYFVSVTAGFARPDSLLAGDRHLTSSERTSDSIVRLNHEVVADWTRAGHEYQGNLLFAGGHVERTTKAGLNYALRQQKVPVSAWVPVAFANASPGSSGAPGSGDATPGGGSSHPGGGGGSGGVGVSATPGSGFAALQRYFEPNASINNPVPTTPAPTTTPAPAPPRGTLPPPVPLAAAAVPVPPAPAPAVMATNPPEPPLAGPQTPTAPAPSDVASSEPSVNFFMVFLRPEQCWYCWLIVMILGFLTGAFLAREVRRRRVASRARPLSTDPAPPPAGPAT